MSRTDAAVLAIHADTTGVSALVVDRSGAIVARGHQQFDQYSLEPGWVEHAPEEMWQATLAGARAALHGFDHDRLVGVGIANQRDTVVLWDRETLGSPRRAIAGQDRRTASVCAEMAAHEDRISELTGLRLDPSFSATKLAWIREHEPQTWAHVESERYAVGTVDSYLVARMTRGLHHVTDVSNASRTLLFDLAAGDWSDELCGLFGVPRDALPELVPSWGHVATTDARSFLGLSVPIAGIAGDRQSALFGQTCFAPGEAKCTYGSGSSILANTGSEAERSDAGLLTTAAWRSPDGENTYALEGSSFVTGPATPEAITSGVRDVVAAMPSLTVLKVDGDAATDDLLCQLQADQLGIDVLRPRNMEAAGLGAAFLAGLGTGVWQSQDELREIWALDRTFSPGTDRPEGSA